MLALLALLPLLPTALAAVNGYCHNDRVPGTCVSKTSCSGAGGTFETGNCPDDPADIVCCSKPACGTPPGMCMWTPEGVSSCSGDTTPNQCPGPSGFTCCLEQGTWPRPTIPTSKCRQVSLDAGKLVLDEFEGDSYTVGCYGERSGPSDHPLGLALDFMVGAYNPAGWKMAEWILDHASELNMKYVIWGQKIRESSEGAAAWENWEDMDDRGDITSNHWDHVHVSFEDV